MSALLLDTNSDNITAYHISTHDLPISRAHAETYIPLPTNDISNYTTPWPRNDTAVASTTTTTTTTASVTESASTSVSSLPTPLASVASNHLPSLLRAPIGKLTSAVPNTADKGIVMYGIGPLVALLTFCFLSW